MSALAMLAAAGTWPALPLTGYVLLARLPGVNDTDRFPALTVGALMTVAGLSVWSVPLLGAAVLGIYHPAYLGILGWGVTLAGLAVLRRNWRKGRAPFDKLPMNRVRPGAGVPSGRPPTRRREGTPAPEHAISRGSWPPQAGARAPRVASPAEQVSTWILTAGLVLAAALYLGFPAESIYGGRDEGVYANSAVHLAQHGRLDVPYPWPVDAAPIFAENWVGFPGFYKTLPSMTVQFGQLFPVWLAQAYSTLGAGGLFRLNAIFALLSLPIFYGLCRTALPAPYATAATLFLAFNPSQLWTARMPLSEVPAQLLIGSGLLTLVEALRRGQPSLARWAGIFLGLAVFARLDSILLLPLLFLAHATVRIIEGPAARSAPVWAALYRVALPSFAVALGYFAYFSTPYFTAPDKLAYLASLRDATLAALIIVLTVIASMTDRPARGGALYHTALPVFVVSLVYCVYLGIPHVPPGSVQPIVASLAASTVVALLCLLVATSGAFRHLRPWLLGRAALAVVGTGLCAAVAYSYWIRSAPSPAPRLSLRWPGYYIDLSRDYSRDALVNLGRYVSPPVIWAAVLGWIVTLWEVARERRHVALAPLLVVGLVVSAVHLHQPIAEDHIWVIRRYLPVAIPAFVLCAALGVHWVLARLPDGWAQTAGALVVLYLVAFTAYADRLILTFAEDKGYFAQIERLAQLAPRDELILARGQTEWITPLYVSFGRRVVPLNLDPGSKGRAAFQTWVAGQTAQGKKVHLLLEGSADLGGYQARKLNEVVITRVFTEPTVDPLPKKLVTKQRSIGLYEIGG